MNTYIVNKDALFEGLKKMAPACKHCGMVIPVCTATEMKDPIDWLEELAQHSDRLHGTNMQKHVDTVRSATPEEQLLMMLDIFNVRDFDIDGAIKKGLLVKVRQG